MLRAGTFLPWTTPSFGYRLDPSAPARRLTDLGVGEPDGQAALERGQRARHLGVTGAYAGGR
jgi:hypothetical protein